MGVGIAAAAAARAEGLSSEEQATRAGEAGFRLLPMNSGDVLLHCYITSHYGFSAFSSMVFPLQLRPLDSARQQQLLRWLQV